MNRIPLWGNRSPMHYMPPLQKDAPAAVLVTGLVSRVTTPIQSHHTQQQGGELVVCLRHHLDQFKENTPFRNTVPDRTFTP